MTAPRIAARYAEALFALAQARNLVEPVQQELAALEELIARSPELRWLLGRPDLAAERKIAALRAGLEGEFSRQTLSVLAALVTHGRGDAVAEVASQYTELADRAAGVVSAEAATAVPLTDAQRNRLTTALERATGQRVRLEERLDTNVVAGVRLRIGDRLIDGSAAGRLARLREELINVTRTTGREDQPGRG